MPLSVYNTLTREKEIFKPLHEHSVGMYVCGPTVYGHAHLGHAKSYVYFDVVLRYLRSLGYNVLYVQNITDVGHLTDDADEGEDKLEKQSRIDKVYPMQLAETYTRSYFEDMDALNILRPDISPRATGHITEQIALIQQLVDGGYAYEVDGSVYFDVAGFPSYGKLSGRKVDELEAGTRVDVKAEKKHPADFALWKKAEKGHIMRWPSPWGEGFPGWHIECSAMSMKYLGEEFDIHGGGIDNQFPHHECEIAQSEGATGKPFVKYWLHNNMVTVGGRKMGKSLGNFITLKDAFKKWSPQVIRFFILQSHYRSSLDFSDEAMEAAAKGLEKLMNTFSNLTDARRTATPDGEFFLVEEYRGRFIAAMDDDFNTPQAIATLFDLSREINRIQDSGRGLNDRSLDAISDFFRLAGGDILGILEGIHRPRQDKTLEAELMQLIITLRQSTREQKLWSLSDMIRERLAAFGITLEDKKDGTTWRKNS